MSENSQKTAKASLFPRVLPYVIAACLLVLVIGLVKQIRDLQGQLQIVRTEEATLRASNDLMQLRVTTLDAKDPTYAAAKVLLAWDPHLHRGTVSLQNLPTPPSGLNYQLWVLDPTAEAPINAGLIAMDAASHEFTLKPMGTENPGFCISLEPEGGRPEPSGPILFAVAPGT